MENRKRDHIEISVREDIEAGSTLFEDVQLLHMALPEIDLEGIDMGVRLFGKSLRYPIIIEAMTGGTKQAMGINAALSKVADDLQIGIGVGSQRAAIEKPSLEKTYRVVLENAPTTLRIANLGAVQLNYNYGLEEFQRAVDMIEADALALHLNPLQEAIQPEGETNFSTLLPKIRGISKNLSVPLIAKEVGCGISKRAAQALISAGIRHIDVGGYGGTSWNRIERYRVRDERFETSEIFDDWGIPTAVSLLSIRALPCQKIASGGIRTGVEAAKAIAMGADAVGIALPLLRAFLDRGEAGVRDYLHQFIDELKLAMFLSGSKDIASLKKAEYRILGKLAQWVSPFQGQKT